MTASTFVLTDERASTQEETMAPCEADDKATSNTLPNDTEEISSTITPSSSQDWSSEEYPSDEEEDGDRVNGTGLVLYVTPTATKAAYWKRRLGWKPNMTKTITKKVKKALFRRPASNSVRKGRSYEINGADAIVASPNKVKNAGEPEEDLLLEYEAKDGLGKVNHDLLIFA